MGLNVYGTDMIARKLEDGESEIPPVANLEGGGVLDYPFTLNLNQYWDKVGH